MPTPARRLSRSATGLAMLVVTVASLACVGGNAPERASGPSSAIDAPERPVSPVPVATPPATRPAQATPSSPRSPKRSGSTRPRSSGSARVSPDGASSDRPDPPVAAPAGSPAETPPPPPSDEDTLHVDRARLEADLAGVESVGDVIGLRPHVTWTGIDGFVVSDLPASSPLSDVGLQQGDVVHSVNGRSLTSIDAAWRLAETLQTADVLEGEITRDGARRRLVVHLD